jgi:SpoVK/Ycf46/Vps4 family AAA+-type ATPase
MENLKDWIRKRSRCYSDEAREFGVEPPKGIVFVGVPGSGKSLAAKAIASSLGIPLVRLDFGRVFNSLVGASEQRMRTALKMVESMAPVVLFADEIDKGLGGIGGSSDGGTSNRVLGSFLSWLQDCEYPVFTMVTANNVDGLPPELLRRGRFDAIFASDLPTPRERREVLRIHLKLRGRDIDDFEDDEIQKVVDASNKYVPAEIESAVKDALVNAFDAEEEMSMKHIVEALTVMVPLSKAFEQQIAKMSDWSKNNATPASAQEDQKAKLVAAAKNRSRISTRVRR